MKVILSLVALIAVVGVVFLQTSDQEAEMALAPESTNGEASVMLAEAAGDSGSASSAAAQGGELYGQYCASCHGESGSSLSAFGNQVEQLQALLGEGAGHPGFGSVLTDEDISNIGAYLASL